MPILIKDIDWNQTQNTVTIKVPLKGAHQSKTDIFYSKSYIKASYEQYFFEVFLLHPVNPKSSNCTVTASYILFELIKCEPQIWETLELNISKAEKQQLKKQCIEEGQKTLQKEHADHLNAKSELKRLTVREQMALDAKQHELIKNIKNDEKNNALKEMDIWKRKHEHQKLANKCKVKGYRIREEVQPSAPAKPQVPPPRTSRIVNVSFTPREFPTPCRESRLEEENEWLRKQAEARRSVGFLSEDLRPEEHNPQFLKSKGDQFLKSRNFLAAISAYSFGIKLSDKFPDLYVGRAEAHLTLGNYNKTVQDATAALDLMKPEVPSNLNERASCIGRRGIALIKLGLMKEGIGELKVSLKLVPNEEFSSQLNDAVENLNNTDENV